jgi:hypothetical protein
MTKKLYDYDVGENVSLFVLIKTSETRIAKNGNKITARFTINKVVANANMENVGIYLGTGILTDEKQKEAELKLGNAVSLDQENTAEIEIPSGLVNESYLYARVGVKSDKSSEYCYSQSIKVALK